MPLKVDCNKSFSYNLTQQIWVKEFYDSFFLNNPACSPTFLFVETFTLHGDNHKVLFSLISLILPFPGRFFCWPWGTWIYTFSNQLGQWQKVAARKLFLLFFFSKSTMWLLKMLPHHRHLHGKIDHCESHFGNVSKCLHHHFSHEEIQESDVWHWRPLSLN